MIMSVYGEPLLLQPVAFFSVSQKLITPVDPPGKKPRNCTVAGHQGQLQRHFLGHRDHLTGLAAKNSNNWFLLDFLGDEKARSYNQFLSSFEKMFFAQRPENSMASKESTAGITEVDSPTKTAYKNLENLVFGVWCLLCSKSGDFLVENGAPNMFAPMLTSALALERSNETSQRFLDVHQITSFPCSPKTEFRTHPTPYM